MSLLIVYPIHLILEAIVQEINSVKQVMAKVVSAVLGEVVLVEVVLLEALGQVMVS